MSRRPRISSVETGIAAALASSTPPTTTVTPADLTTSQAGGPYLQGWPTSSHYTISINTGNVVQVTPTGGTTVDYNNGAGCSKVS